MEMMANVAAYDFWLIVERKYIIICYMYILLNEQIQKLISLSCRTLMENTKLNTNIIE